MYLQDALTFALSWITNEMWNITGLANVEHLKQASGNLFILEQFSIIDYKASNSIL